MRDDALSGACKQLQSVLARVEQQFQRLTGLFEILEKDVLLVGSTSPFDSDGTLHPTLQLFRGTLQQQTAVLLEHQTRLELLTAELNLGSANTSLINSLLVSFSRLFASVQDAAWIGEQDQPERFTERLVDGYLPRAAGCYLVGEGQWMLGKFTAGVEDWSTMEERLMGHQRWTTALFNRVPPGHALAQPLLLTLLSVEAMLAKASEQVRLEHAHREIRRIGEAMVGTPGADRVFPLEERRLRCLIVPFPQRMEAIEE